MTKTDEQGSLLVPFILALLLFFAAAGFGVWAYMSRQDYKNNTGQKVAAAVAVAKRETSSAKDNEFVAKEKLPLKTYNGPAAYGSLSLQYPKTWSAYVIEGMTSSQAVDGYFHPGFVPDITGTTAFALRIQVTADSYDQELAQYDVLTKNGQVKASPYQLPRVATVSGVRIDGAISNNKTGSIVLLPLRDKTLKIWTESNSFVDDFNNNILPNLTFSP